MRAAIARRSASADGAGDARAAHTRVQSIPIRFLILHFYRPYKVMGPGDKRVAVDRPLIHWLISYNTVNGQ